MSEIVTFEDIEALLADRSPEAIACATSWVRRRIALHRALPIHTRLRAYRMLTAFEARRAAGKAYVLTATDDDRRELMALDGRHFVRTFVGSDVAGRPRHAYLPLLQTADFATAPRPRGTRLLTSSPFEEEEPWCPHPIAA